MHVLCYPVISKSVISLSILTNLTFLTSFCYYLRFQFLIKFFNYFFVIFHISFGKYALTYLPSNASIYIRIVSQWCNQFAVLTPCFLHHSEIFRKISTLMKNVLNVYRSMKSIFTTVWFNPLDASVAPYIETSQLVCCAVQINWLVYLWGQH